MSFRIACSSPSSSGRSADSSRTTARRCDETQLPFNFQLFDATWEAPKLADLIAKYEAALPACAWPDWVLGNHDQHRVVTRLGPDLARVATMLLLTLRGTPTLYYGDELGLPDAVVPLALAQDPLEKQEPGHGLGRDPERSPMPWDARANAGFTSGRPWLPLVSDWQTLNVSTALNDPDSVLALHRRLLALRRAAPTLAVGSYAALPSPGSDLRIHATAGRPTELPRRAQRERRACGILSGGRRDRRDDRHRHESRAGRRACGATGPPGCTRRDRCSLGPVTASPRALTARANVTPPLKQSRPRHARWDAALPAAASPRPTRRTRTARRRRREFAAAVSARLRLRDSAAARR